jgi:phosphoribosylanthranilate isomerase
MSIQLKICGLKFQENIKQVTAIEPDYAGFIFYKNSARYVGEHFPAESLRNIRNTIKKVGVFVNEALDNVINISNKYKLDFVQLHGDETPEYCSHLQQITGIIKTFGIDEHFDFSACRRYEKYCTYFLFDTATPSYGGSGKSYNRNLLQRYQSDTPFFLSGGVGLEEVRSIQDLHHEMMLGIDVNSKFESSIGYKNIEQLQKLKSKLK